VLYRMVIGHFESDRCRLQVQVKGELRIGEKRKNRRQTTDDSNSVDQWESLKAPLLITGH